MTPRQYYYPTRRRVEVINETDSNRPLNHKKDVEPVLENALLRDQETNADMIFSMSMDIYCSLESLRSKLGDEDTNRLKQYVTAVADAVKALTSDYGVQYVRCWGNEWGGDARG